MHILHSLFFWTRWLFLLSFHLSRASAPLKAFPTPCLLSYSCYLLFMSRCPNISSGTNSKNSVLSASRQSLLRDHMVTQFFPHCDFSDVETFPRKHTNVQYTNHPPTLLNTLPSEAVQEYTNVYLSFFGSSPSTTQKCPLCKSLWSWCLRPKHEI